MEGILFCLRRHFPPLPSTSALKVLICCVLHSFMDVFLDADLVTHFSLCYARTSWAHCQLWFLAVPLLMVSTLQGYWLSCIIFIFFFPTAFLLPLRVVFANKILRHPLSYSVLPESISAIPSKAAIRNAVALLYFYPVASCSTELINHQIPPCCFFWETTLSKHLKGTRKDDTKDVRNERWSLPLSKWWKACWSIYHTARTQITI